MSAYKSAAIAECNSRLIEALHRALTIAVDTGRTHGPEFNQVSALIRRRDELRRESATLDGAPLTAECKCQLMGGG